MRHNSSTTETDKLDLKQKQQRPRHMKNVSEPDQQKDISHQKNSNSQTRQVLHLSFRRQTQSNLKIMPSSRVSSKQSPLGRENSSNKVLQPIELSSRQLSVKKSSQVSSTQEKAANYRSFQTSFQLKALQQSTAVERTQIERLSGIQERQSKNQMIISGEAFCLSTEQSDTNFAIQGIAFSSRISPQESKALRTSRPTNPYQDVMDLDEVMMRADDKSSDGGSHEFYQNDSRVSSRQSRNRKSSLKVICVDKSQASDSKPVADTNASGSVNLSLSRLADKQIMRQNQRAVIARAVKRHSRQRIKASLLSGSESDQAQANPQTSGRVTKTIAGLETGDNAYFSKRFDPGNSLSNRGSPFQQSGSFKVKQDNQTFKQVPFGKEEVEKALSNQNRELSQSNSVKSVSPSTRQQRDLFNVQNHGISPLQTSQKQLTPRVQIHSLTSRQSLSQVQKQMSGRSDPQAETPGLTQRLKQSSKNSPDSSVPSKYQPKGKSPIFRQVLGNKYHKIQESSKEHEEPLDVKELSKKLNVPFYRDNQPHQGLVLLLDFKLESVCDKSQLKPAVFRQIFTYQSIQDQSKVTRARDVSPTLELFEFSSF